MIVFEKRPFGLNTVFWTTFVGSAWPKAFPSSALAVGIHLGLTLGLSDSQRDSLKLEHPYAVGVVFAAIGFLIVFRANHAYNRMGEGAAWLFHLESRLFDSVTQSTAFHKQSQAFKEGRPESKVFFSRLYHLHSLALAMCCLCLRRDNECNNVQKHLHGSESTEDAMNSRKIPIERIHQYRPRNLLSRWSYAASMRSSEIERARYYKHNKLDVLGGVSERQLQALRACRTAKGRAHLAIQWLTDYITSEQQKGSFGKVPPPVIARLYQWLSEAALGFNKALRVVDVPFPFIIAQIAELAVLSLVPLVPLLHVSFVRESDWIGAALTFITCFIFIGLYESARDVEDPFVYEPNDLPLSGICHRFNESIEAIQVHSAPPWDDQLDAPTAHAAPPPPRHPAASGPAGAALVVSAPTSFSALPWQAYGNGAYNGGYNGAHVPPVKECA